MSVVQERPQDAAERQSGADSDLQNDLDLFHVLPLVGLPLQTPALRQARMIKSQNLESMIEVFRDQVTGSGQVAINDLTKQFGEQLSPEDIKLLQKLGRLNSYDPFSLRITLRDMGLLTDDLIQVNLSDEKQQELEKFMQSFTRPLIQQVFGDEETDIEKFEDIISVFKDPDAGKVRHNLGKLAAQLKIEILDIPKFLEDFSDAHVTPSRDSTGSIIGYHSNRRVPNRKTLETHIIPLYKQLLTIEKQHASPKEGMAAAVKVVTDLLAEKKMSFNELMFSLGV